MISTQPLNLTYKQWTPSKTDIRLHGYLVLVDTKLSLTSLVYIKNTLKYIISISILLKYISILSIKIFLSNLIADGRSLPVIWPTPSTDKQLYKQFSIYIYSSTDVSVIKQSNQKFCKIFRLCKTSKSITKRTRVFISHKWRVYP